MSSRIFYLLILSSVCGVAEVNTAGVPEDRRRIRNFRANGEEFPPMGVHADLTQEWERQQARGRAGAGRNVFNDTLQISPLLLDRNWPAIDKLVGLFVISCYGIISNSYYVASFFVEESLQSKGYSYLTCMGVADLMISVVISISTVLQLAHDWVTVNLCNFLHFVTTMSTYAYCMLNALAGFETYVHHCWNSFHQAVCVKPAGIIIGIVSCLSFFFAYFDVYFKLSYDYCKRESYGLYSYRVATLTIFQIIPCFMGFAATLRGYYHVESYARIQLLYRRSHRYARDRSLALASITATLLYVLFWGPHVYFSHLTGDHVSDKRYYYSAWLGISRAVISSTVFCIMDSNFQRAYANIFRYCVCRSTLNGVQANRNRRAPDDKPDGVAVHILAKAMNVSTPQRSASSSQETQAL